MRRRTTRRTGAASPREGRSIGFPVLQMVAASVLSSCSESRGSIGHRQRTFRVSIYFMAERRASKLVPVPGNVFRARTCAAMRVLDRRGSGTVGRRMRVCWCLVGSRVSCDNRRILMVVCHRSGRQGTSRPRYTGMVTGAKQIFATGDGKWLGRPALWPRWAQRPGGGAPGVV